MSMNLTPIYGQNPSGTQKAVQVDASGNLIVSATGSTPNVNVAQVGGNNVATAASGIMKVGVTDASGNAINSTSNALNTSIQNTTIAVTQSGTWTVQPGNTPNSSAWLTQPVAGTTGGSTPNHAISANTTNATSVKGSAGLVYGITISNTNASARFFKLYDKATAPTVGTDTPKTTIQIPANSTVARVYPVGLTFALGIGYGATTGIADSDTGAVGANDLSMDVDYK